MKTSTIMKSVYALAIAGLLGAGSAHAAMGTCIVQVPLQPGATVCPESKGDRAACPLSGESANPGSGCGLGNPQLGRAIGSVAAGGMEIAATVMRALIGEANKVLGPTSGM